MIVNAIISAFLAAVTALTSLLPSFTLPDPQDTEIFHYIAQWNGIMPVQFLSQCIVVSLGLSLSFILFDGGLWLYHQIHGSD